MSQAHRILIVDDETSIRNMLKLHLESSSLRTEEAKNGEQGLAALRSDHFHLVLLDLGLPDMDGVQVLKGIRTFSEVPVIVMTVRNEDRDKVAALDSGADDYIVKPFSLEELKARVRAALRRSSQMSIPENYENGCLSIDFAGRRVEVQGHEIKLTQKEFELLKLLALQAGKLVTRGQILQRIWGDSSEDKGHYLRIYVGQLRKKLGIKDLITTDPGVGYRLNFIE